jgi:hypothetical protein
MLFNEQELSALFLVTPPAAELNFATFLRPLNTPPSNYGWLGSARQPFLQQSTSGKGTTQTPNNYHLVQGVLSQTSA